MDFKKILAVIVVIAAILFIGNMVFNNGDGDDFTEFNAEAHVAAAESSVDLISSTEATQDKFVLQERLKTAITAIGRTVLPHMEHTMPRSKWI